MDVENEKIGFFHHRSRGSPTPAVYPKTFGAGEARTFQLVSSAIHRLGTSWNLPTFVAFVALFLVISGYVFMLCLLLCLDN